MTDNWQHMIHHTQAAGPKREISVLLIVEDAAEVSQPVS